MPRPELVLVIAIGVGQAAALVITILLLRAFIDALVWSPSDLVGLIALSAMLGAAMLASAGLRTAEFAAAERMGFNVVRKLRMDMHRHLQGMAPRQLQHRSRGALLLRFTGDLTMLRTWISRGIARSIVAAIVVCGGLAVLAFVSAQMAVAVLGILSVGTALSLRSGLRLQRTTRWVRRKRSLLTSNIDEQIAALPTVQVFGRTGGESRRLGRQNDSLTRTLIVEARIRAWLRGLSAATGSLAAVAVLGVGALQVHLGTLSVGSVVAAMVVARMLATPARTLGLAHDYWQRAQVSRRKIAEFMVSSSRSLDAEGGDPLRVRRGKIELREVRVAGSVDGVTVEVEPGHCVVITGPTGAGKSTLLSVVARLTEADGGQVLIDDQDVAQCSLHSATRQIGVVSPDLPLMRGTLRRNVTYRWRTAPPQEIARVVLALNLDAAFASRAMGLDAWISEGGASLSVGERQLIALARALVGNPRILLLDDPMAPLDPAGRENLRGIVGRHSGTVLMVSNDPADLELADVVWRMEGGRITDIQRGRSHAHPNVRKRSARSRLGPQMAEGS